MNKSDIDHILDKYWEGESSVSEENTLRAYFASGRIDASHVPYAPLFGYFEEQAAIEYKPKAQIKTLGYRRWISIAALALFALASIVIVKTYLGGDVTDQAAMVEVASDEIQDPEEAKRITEDALMLIAEKFNLSQDIVVENMEHVEKAIIFKQ